VAAFIEDVSGRMGLHLSEEWKAMNRSQATRKVCSTLQGYSQKTLAAAARGTSLLAVAGLE